MNFRPIFIGGCDRSGTTLLGDLLGSANWTFVSPESQFFHDLLMRMKLGAFDLPEDAARWLYGHFRYSTWELNLDIEQLTQLIDLQQPRATIEAIVEKYLHQKHPDKSHADVWIDHTPDNFKYHSALKAIFPEARFIHIVRDGRAVSTSIKDLEWGPNNAYSASRHWAERLQQALSVETSEGSNCFRLHYEQLLTAPEQVLRKLCDFIDIPYDPEMLNGGGLRLPSFTRNQHNLVGKAPQRDKIDSWRSKMSVTELRDFESYPFSRLLLDKMGYSPHFANTPRLSRLRVLNRYLHEFVFYIMNRIRHSRMESNVVNAYQHQQKSSVDKDIKKSSISNTKFISSYRS